MDSWTLGHLDWELDTWTFGHLDTWTGNWTLGHLYGELDTWAGDWTLGHLDGELDTSTAPKLWFFSMKGKCKNEAEVTSFSFLFNFILKSRTFFLRLLGKNYLRVWINSDPILFSS